MTNFESFNLDPRLFVGISKEGYANPTPIQMAAIPIALTGSDLIGIAQTGTGKTAAFVLPILQKLLESKAPAGITRALIITPTRELAEQIHQTIIALGVGTKIKSATIYGGVSPLPQIRALRAGVEILVACPGRLLDHVRQKNAKLRSVEFLVLDEADRMLDMGFLPPVQDILKEVSAKRQTLLFSATFAPEIARLADQTMKDPQRIEVGLSRPAHTVTHAIFPVPTHLKTSLLMELLSRTDTESVLIFTRTKHRAEKLAPLLEKAGHKVTTLHSNKSQSQRQHAIKGFKEGKYEVMVATDVAARGIDVSSISHVINFDIPNSVDAYIHRVGRTGRAEKTGDAFTLVAPEDNSMVKTIERMMGKPLPRQIVSSFDYTTPATSSQISEQRQEDSERNRTRSSRSGPSAPSRSRFKSGGDARPASGARSQGQYAPRGGAASRPSRPEGGASYREKPFPSQGTSHYQGQRERAPAGTRPPADGNKLHRPTDTFQRPPQAFRPSRPSKGEDSIGNIRDNPRGSHPSKEGNK